MIQFFRRIRQRLLVENRFSKYLFYAIGEIVLVVFGILIALQINSWNQARINNQLENKYLLLLTEEVRSEVDYLKNLKNNFGEMRLGLERITRQWQSDSPVITDTVQYLLDYTYGSGMDPWYREPVTWTQLQQTGELILLRDKRLTDDLFVFYSNVDILAENYLNYPMQQFMRTRVLMDKPILNYGGIITLYKYVGALNLEKETDYISGGIFPEIWNYRESLLPNFSTILGIYHFQEHKLQAVIEIGEGLLKRLESSQTNS